jgi:integrase
MRESNKLTTKLVEQIRTPGIYRDGRGLLLRVEPSGARRWVIRVTVRGNRRDIGLGSAQDISLKQARDAADGVRAVVRAGRDPVIERRQARREITTFEHAARQVHAEFKSAWSNGKHIDQWINTLETYAFPSIGKKSVGEVDSADVQRILSPIWATKPETARRVRQRIGRILDWAVAAGSRSATLANAAHIVRSGLPPQKRVVRHHPAVPWQDVAKVISEIRNTPSAEEVRWALEFLILTAGRTGEVLGAQWCEVNRNDALWVVPANRMKMKREHRVPLSDAAINLLSEAHARWPGSKLVFPSRETNSKLSDMALLMVMRRLERQEVPHGFRSSFRDWAAEHHWSTDAAEAALAHTPASKVIAAYQRTDLLDIRRNMMQAWADHCTGVPSSEKKEMGQS